MAKSRITFADRFPFAGLFIVIALVLAIPLTVWSLNNISTQTKQEAAYVTPTTYPTCRSVGKSCSTSLGACCPGLACVGSTLSKTCKKNCTYAGGSCVSSAYCKGRGGIIISYTYGCATGAVCCDF